MYSLGIATQAEDLIVAGAKELTDSLCKEMDEKGIAYRRGFHRTTDAGYVQTIWSAKYYKDKGVLCVEMEGAGLLAVAGFRSCRATGIYVISDSGSGDDWNLGWGEKVLETSINKVIDAIANNGSMDITIHKNSRPNLTS